MATTKTDETKAVEEATSAASNTESTKAKKNPATTAAKATRKRIPLGTRNRLTAPTRPGFVRRFVNDIGDRIQRFKDAGWDVVDASLPVGDEKIGRASNIGSMTNPEVGKGQRSILMEIPEEFKAEDDAVKQAKISAVESQIKRDNPKLSKDGLTGAVSIS